MSSVPNYGRHRYDEDYAPRKASHLRVAKPSVSTAKPVKSAKKRPVRKRNISRRPVPVNKGSVVAQFLVVGAMAATVTFGFSVLMGKSMAEKASREIGMYHQRAKAAEAETDLIRQRLDIRVNPKKVEDWAENHGFTKETTGVSQK